MDTLTLRIENFATLDGGSPVSITLAGKGARVGRKMGNDWILPDPSRHISSHHFDISYENGRYVLADLSSNGTFLQGERYRLSAPHPIAHGDRFTVGHYIIGASITVAPNADPAQPPAAPAPVPQPPAPPAAQPDEFDDVWGDLGGSSAHPVQAPPTSHVMQPGGVPGLSQPPGAMSEGVQAPSFGAFEGTDPSGLSSPPMQFAHQTPSGVTTPPHLAPAMDPTAGPAPIAPTPAEPVAAPMPAPPPPAPQSPPSLDAMEGRGLGESFSDAGPALTPSNPVAAMDGTAGDQFLQAFIQSAGIEPSQAQIPPQELGEMIGTLVRNGTEELMRMLQERAAVKLFVASEDRTVRVATGNNPMKFMPDAPQAFEALFVKPRDGYQTGADGFANALEDVRRHQAAVMAAIQPGLAEMLEGLSPEEIEEDIGGGMLSGGGRKAWDKYTQRWETRAAEGDNGMLDAFIKAFARHYSDALRKM